MEAVEVSIPSEPGIYKILHRDTDDIYVGQSADMARRVYQHLNGIRTGTHPTRKIQTLAKKYGAEGFVFEVIEKCAECALDEREAFWIGELDPSLNSSPGNRPRGNEEGASVRVEFDSATNDALEYWAEQECRSKREHVAYLVKVLCKAHDKDPLIWARLMVEMFSKIGID